MVSTRFRPNRFQRETPFRLIYFIDGVRVRKVDAIRAVMLHLILSHSPDWDYRAAEREIAHSAPPVDRRGRQVPDAGTLQASGQSVWAEQQKPKIKRERR
jgi:hypothetical protein